MVEYVEHFLRDERLQMAYLGQGVIGTNASPHDPGTASIHFHHQSGRLGGLPGMPGGTSRGGWGWSRSSSATPPATRARWSRPECRSPGSCPGEGVELDGGERIDGPRRRLQRRPARDAAAPRAGRRRRPGSPGRDRSRWPAARSSSTSRSASCPDFRARPGTARAPPPRARSTLPLTKDEWTRRSCEPPGPGELPERLWAELYFQTAHDPSVAPAGRAHDERLRPVRAPHFADGDWDTRREEVRRLAFESIGRFCANMPDAVDRRCRCSARPTSSAKVGLTGRTHLPGRMPAAVHVGPPALAYRTPMPGVFLCGACTHPGGSVIARQRPERGDGGSGSTVRADCAGRNRTYDLQVMSLAS